MRYCLRNMIYGLRRMIYLLRKHDIISVPIIREAYIIRVSGFHRVSDIIRDQRERISLKKALAFASAFFLAQKERLARLCLAFATRTTDYVRLRRVEFESLCIIFSSVKVFPCFPLAVPKEIFALLACSISLTATPTRTPCIAHRARSCSLPAPEPSLGSDFHYRAKQKRHPYGCLFYLAQKERLELSRRFPDLRP